MGIISIILIGIGLAMDAFAVSLTIGLETEHKNRNTAALKSGMYFGGFQALMPLIGWFLGVNFIRYIEKVDHWIAFILLSVVGGKMIIDSLKNEEDEEESINSLSHKKFMILAIATSIDALAVGLSCAFLNINILTVILIVGLITFALSMFAVFAGKIFGVILKDKAGIVGGVILIGIGLNILIEHLEIFRTLI